MILITEITDFRRFSNPRSLIAYLGLIPSEDSSGGMQKGGCITKTGNHRCRTQLIESVQHAMKKPIISYKMKHNLEQVDPASATIAIKCMHRLNKRFWALIMKGKSRKKALTAIARELIGFIWAMMTQTDLFTQLDRVGSGRILNTDGNQPTHSSLIHRRKNLKRALELTIC